jgi:hypothetical protein
MALSYCLSHGIAFSSFLLFLFHRMFSITDMKSRGRGTRLRGHSWKQSNEAQLHHLVDLWCSFLIRKYPLSAIDVSYYCNMPRFNRKDDGRGRGNSKLNVLMTETLFHLCISLVTLVGHYQDTEGFI